MSEQLNYFQGLFGHCKQLATNSYINIFALAGNRTRAVHVAGEHSTTEPPMLMNMYCISARHTLLPANAV